MKRVLALVSIVFILIPLTVACGGGNSLLGTWASENPRGSFIFPGGGVRGELVFSSNSVWFASYYEDGSVEVPEATYSTSGGEITVIFDGRAETIAYQIVGDDLVIGREVFTRVSSNQRPPTATEPEPESLITIPVFVGYRYDDIINNEEYAELYTFNNATIESSNEVAEGIIISQDPAPYRERKMPLSGERINIRLIVSSGD